MKRYILSLFICTLLLTGCRENMPVIDCLTCEDGPDGPDEQVRKVLIEEFTGVRCVNCPQGSAQIEVLLEQYGEQLIPISIHAGFFSNPYTDSQYNFKTPEGDDIIGFLGEPQGYPSAVINRKKFSGQESLQLPQSAWAGLIPQELDIEPIINVELENTYDSATRSLTVKVGLTPIDDIEDDLRISIMVLENDIIDLQLTPDSSTPDPEYKHKHVLRDMLTDSSGDDITEDLTASTTIEKEFTFTIPDEWVATNCSTVAFVHRADNMEVLQADEAGLAE